jgi:hypothetical protein
LPADWNNANRYTAALPLAKAVLLPSFMHYRQLADDEVQEKRNMNNASASSNDSGSGGILSWFGFGRNVSTIASVAVVDEEGELEEPEHIFANALLKWSEAILTQVQSCGDQVDSQALEENLSKLRSKLSTWIHLRSRELKDLKSMDEEAYDSVCEQILTELHALLLALLPVIMTTVRQSIKATAHIYLPTHMVPKPETFVAYPLRMVNEIQETLPLGHSTIVHTNINNRKRPLEEDETNRIDTTANDNTNNDSTDLMVSMIKNEDQIGEHQLSVTMSAEKVASERLQQVLSHALSSHDQTISNNSITLTMKTPAPRIAYRPSVFKANKENMHIILPSTKEGDIAELLKTCRKERNESMIKNL